MATKIIAVSGRKFSGKSSLCNYLQAYLGERSHNQTNPTNPVKVDQGSTGELQWFECVYSPTTDHSVVQKMDVGTQETNRLFPEYFERIAKVYNFADSLKNLCIDLLGLNPEQVWGTEEQKNSLTRFVWENLPDSVRIANSKITNTVYVKEPLEFGGLRRVPQTITEPRSGRLTAREVMQIAGTDIMRKMFYENVWVDATIRKISKEKPPFAFIGDMRFKVEFKAVQDAGGYVIRLERSPFASDTHASEVDFDGFDFRSYPRTLVIPADADIWVKNAMVVNWFEQVVLKDN